MRAGRSARFTTNLQKDAPRQSLLGTPGFAATLVNLPKDLSRFNGRMTHPRKVGPLFRVHTEQGGGKSGKVQLQLPAKYLRLVKEHALAMTFESDKRDDEIASLKEEMADMKQAMQMLKSG